MNSTSLDISGKIDAPAVHALSGVKAAADSLNIPFFIIGASARDIFLKHLYGFAQRRSTVDMDFGVFLSARSRASNTSFGGRRTKLAK
jgi:predicted nucleotidyltransferase